MCSFRPFNVGWAKQRKEKTVAVATVVGIVPSDKCVYMRVRVCGCGCVWVYVGVCVCVCGYRWVKMWGVVDSHSAALAVSTKLVVGIVLHCCRP